MDYRWASVRIDYGDYYTVTSSVLGLTWWADSYIPIQKIRITVTWEDEGHGTCNSADRL